MLRHNITLRRKVKVNQSEPQGKYLKYAQFIEQESLAEKIARFFKSIDDVYRQQTDDQMNTYTCVQSESTSDDDYAAYRAKIDQYFVRLENICTQEQLQPVQQMTYTPAIYTPTTYTPAIYTPAINPPVIYTPSMHTPITYVPNNYLSSHYTYTLCSGDGYSYVSCNYGVCQCETDNNYHHTDHAYCNKYIADV